VELETFDNSFALQQLQASAWKENLQAQRGTSLLVKLDKKQIPAFHRALLEMNIAVLSLQPRHSLEDYFLQVTSGNQHVDSYSN
jgi:hypothetical protein